MEKLLAIITIHWDVIIFEIIALIVLMFIIVLIALYIYNKSKQEYNSKNWNYILKHRKIIAWAASSNEFMKHNVFYMVALSYFENNCTEDFYKNIMKVTHKKLINRKYFWVSIFYLLQGDEKYQEWYAQLKKSDSEVEKEHFLKTFMLCEKVIRKTGEVSLDEKSEINSMHSERLKNILLENSK